VYSVHRHSRLCHGRSVAKLELIQIINIVRVIQGSYGSLGSGTSPKSKAAPEPEWGPIAALKGPVALGIAKSGRLSRSLPKKQIDTSRWIKYNPPKTRGARSFNRWLQLIQSNMEYTHVGGSFSCITRLYAWLKPKRYFAIPVWRNNGWVPIPCLKVTNTYHHSDGDPEGLGTTLIHWQNYLRSPTYSIPRRSGWYVGPCSPWARWNGKTDASTLFYRDRVLSPFRAIVFGNRAPECI
jgi:hypothetical protein